MKVDIVPAVLPHSSKELEDGLHMLHGIAPLVQVDVVGDVFDGHESLPMWEEFDFEFDIFIEPVSFVTRALELGASRVVVHARHQSASEALAALQHVRGGDLPTAVGLGLRSGDNVDTAAPHLSSVDYVQVMGIEHEGKQGEPFDPHAVELVTSLRRAHPNLFIQVDGATASHVKELVAAGANRLIVGSAILSAENPNAVYKELYTEANG